MFGELVALQDSMNWSGTHGFVCFFFERERTRAREAEREAEREVEGGRRV
jgi:hypothetical protein